MALYRVSARDKLPRMLCWPAFQQPWSRPGTQALSMTTGISLTPKRPLRQRPGTMGDRMHASRQINHNPHQLTTNGTPLDPIIHGHQTPMGDSNGLALIQASRAKGVEHYLNGLSGEGSTLPVAAPVVHDPSPHKVMTQPNMRGAQVTCHGNQKTTYSSKIYSSERPTTCAWSMGRIPKELSALSRDATTSLHSLPRSGKISCLVTTLTLGRCVPP